MATTGLRSLLLRRGAPRGLIPSRGGGGGPVAREALPAKEVPAEDDYIWYDGTANPEPVLDRFDLVTSTQALGALCMGFAAFATVGVCGYLYNPTSRAPWIPKEFPYDNLKVEMGQGPRK